MGPEYKLKFYSRRFFLIKLSSRVLDQVFPKIIKERKDSIYSMVDGVLILVLNIVFSCFLSSGNSLKYSASY